MKPSNSQWFLNAVLFVEISVAAQYTSYGLKRLVHCSFFHKEARLRPSSHSATTRLRRGMVYSDLGYVLPPSPRLRWTRWTCPRLEFNYGSVAKWSNAPRCKRGGSAFGGSTPSRPTTLRPPSEGYAWHNNVKNGPHPKMDGARTEIHTFTLFHETLPLCL